MLHQVISRLSSVTKHSVSSLQHRCQSTFKLLNAFYMAVHPDFFNAYPREQKINEESLKVLHSYLNSIEKKEVLYCCGLTFFVKEQKPNGDSISEVKVKLNSKTTLQTVNTILQACGLPNSAITQKLQEDVRETKVMSKLYDDEHLHVYDLRVGNFGSLGKKRLGDWLKNNHETVETSQKNGDKLMAQITETMQSLNQKHGVTGLSKDSFTYALALVSRGLKQVETMLDRYYSDVGIVSGRLIKFGPFNGLDHIGRVVFNINDLPSDWKVGLSRLVHDTLILTKIKNLELSLKDRYDLNFIRPRNAGISYPIFIYFKGLEKIYSTFSISKDKKYVPYKDVLMVYDWYADYLNTSPEGYVKVPSNASENSIAMFLDKHIGVIRRTRTDYLQNLNIEKRSMSLCESKLSLGSLEKDYSVNTQQAVRACDHLMFNEFILLKQVALVLSKYYSVSADGLVRIPWNFEV